MCALRAACGPVLSFVFAGAFLLFLQVVATGSVSLAMVSVSEGELYRHLIAMLSASEPSTMDDVYGRMCQK